MSLQLGVWPVRARAERLGALVAQRLGGELFRPWELPEPQKAQFQARFEQRSQWVLVMATGIATRFVEGLLRDKHQDPAVVVLDEAGRYAVVLLGGHESGANALAYHVANAVGAIPVVTTATEAIRPLVVGIGCRKGVSEDQIEHAVHHALARLEHRTQTERFSHSNSGSGGDWGGSGSTSNSSPPGGGRTVLEAIRELVTIDLKAQEQGLLAFAQRHGIPLRVIAKEQIVARPWVTQRSDWVQQSVGVDGVCEPCALIACTRGRLVVPKTTLDGVAVAVVEDLLGFEP